MAERKIDAISIGIGADISGLRESLSQASAEIARWTPPKKTVDVFVVPRWGSPTGTSAEDVKFKKQLDTAIGRFRTAVAKVQTDIDTGLTFNASFVPVKASIDSLQTKAQEVMDKEGQPILVSVAPNVDSAKALHNTLQEMVTAQGPIKVPIKFVGKWPPPGTPGTGDEPAEPATKPKRPKGGKGGGGATPAAEEEAGTVAGAVPVARTRRSRRAAPTPGAVVGAPAKGAASGPVGAPARDTLRKPSELGTTTPEEANAAGAAFAASLTPEALQSKALAAKYKELEERGIIFGVPPGEEMRWQLAREHGKPFRHATIAGIRPGSHYAQHPGDLETEVTNILSGKTPGRRVGTDRPITSRKRYRAPGFTGQAESLGSVDRPQEWIDRAGSIQELLQIAENLSNAVFNEQTYKGEHPEYDVMRDVTPEMRQQFDLAAAMLQPYQTVISGMQAKVQAGEEISPQDLADIQNLLTGDPTKIKFKDPATGRKVNFNRISYIPTGETEPVKTEGVLKELFGAVPSLSSGLTDLRTGRVGKPSQFFRTIGSKKGLDWVNPDTGEDVEGVSGTMLALAHGWRSMIGSREEETGGVRGVLKEYQQRQAAKAAAARRRKEKQWFHTLDKIPDEQQRLIKLRELVPDLVPENDEQALGFLRGRMKIQREGGWAPNPRVGKMGLGGNIPGLSLGADLAKGIFPRLRNTGQVAYIEDAMKGMFPNAEIDLSGTLAANLAPIGMASEKLATAFPTSARHLTGIRALDDREFWTHGGIAPPDVDKVAAFYDRGDTYRPTPRGRSISLNRRYLQMDPITLRAQAKASSRKAFHSPSWRGSEDVFAHELGHHVDLEHDDVLEFMSMTGLLPWTSIYGNQSPAEHSAEAFQHWFKTGDVVRPQWERTSFAPGKLVNPQTGELVDYETMLKRRGQEDQAVSAFNALRMADVEGRKFIGFALGGEIEMRKGGAVRRQDKKYGSLSALNDELRWLKSSDPDYRDVEIDPVPKRRKISRSKRVSRPGIKIGTKIPVPDDLDEFDPVFAGTDMEFMDDADAGSYDWMRRNFPVFSGMSDAEIIAEEQRLEKSDIQSLFDRESAKQRKRDRIDTTWPRINRDIVGSSLHREIDNPMELISDWLMDRGMGLGPSFMFDPNRQHAIPGALELMINKQMPKPHLLGGQTRVGGGGIERVGVGGQHLWDAPGPGWIIPHHLVDKMPVRKDGGKTPKNRYLVGEAGDELFVPEALGGIIPPKVMAQLPKRQDGGAVGDQAHPMTPGERMFHGMDAIGGIERGGDPFTPIQQAHQMGVAERLINSMVTRVTRPEWNPIQQAHQMAPGWEPPARPEPAARPPVMQAHQIPDFQMQLPLMEGAPPMRTRAMGPVPAAAPTPPVAPEPVVATPTPVAPVTAAPVMAAAAAAVEAPLTGSVRAPEPTPKTEYDTTGAPGFKVGPFNWREKPGFFSAEAPALSKGTIGGGDIQRVFVTNWPPALSGRGPITQREKVLANEQAKAFSAQLPEGISIGSGTVSGQPVAAPTRRARVRGTGDLSGVGKAIKEEAKAPEPGTGEAEKPLARPSKGTLSERIQRRLNIRGQYLLESEIPELRAEQTAELGKATPRALTTSFGEAAMYTAGGRQVILKRQRQAAAVTQFAQAIRTERQALEENQLTLEFQREQTKEGSDEYKNYTDQINEHIDARKNLAEWEQKELTLSRDLTKGITGWGSAMRAQTANMVGITGGMIVFQGAMALAQTGMQLLSDATAPMIEQGTGFTKTTSQMTKALGGQVREMKGAIDSTVALYEANTGLSARVADMVDPYIKQRTAVEGGNAALQDQIALIQSSMQLRRQEMQTQAGQAAGPFQPAGGIMGITRSTGGWMNTPIGATPSMFEALSQVAGTSGGQNLVRNVMSSFNLGGTGVSGASQMFIDLLGANKVKTPAEISRDNALALEPKVGTGLPPTVGGGFGVAAMNMWNSLGPTSPSTARPGGFASRVTRVPSMNDQVNQLFNPTSWQTMGTQQKAEATQAAAFSTTMESMIDNAKKGGSAINFLTRNQKGYTAEVQKASDEFLLAQGVGEETVKVLHDWGYAMADLEDPMRKLSRIDMEKFGKGAALGATKMDRELMLRQMNEYQIPAFQRNVIRQREFQTQVAQPAQFALSQMANPTVPAAGGIPYGQDPRLYARAVGGQAPMPAQLLSGPGFKFGADQAQAKTFAKMYGDMKALDTATDYLNKKFEIGKNTIAGWDIDKSLLEDLQSVGMAIVTINKDLTQKQTNLSVAEYTNSIRIANRSIKDAQQMWAGIKGSVGTTYGYLEGMNIRMSRQLQLLGFELQQRQINFQLASAGFVAPGTTPEERAARIEAAKIEAEYAQKQLDLQRQIAQNQYSQTGIGAQRAVTDLAAQRDLMLAGRALVQETAAAQAALERLTQARDEMMTELTTNMQGYLDVGKATLDSIYEMESQTGILLNKELAAIAGAWSTAASDYNTKYLQPTLATINSIFKSLGIATVNMASTRSGGAWGNKPQAEGMLGQVNTATNLLVGEAGPETVAILRNPRQVLAEGLSRAGSGGGGGGTFNVIFNNPVVRDDHDLDLIIRKVEAALMRKTTLFGLRRM